MHKLNNFFAPILLGVTIPNELLAWLENMRLFSPLTSLVLFVLSVVSVSIVIRNGLIKSKNLKLEKRIKEMQLQDEIDKHLKS